MFHFCSLVELQVVGHKFLTQVWDSRLQCIFCNASDYELNPAETSFMGNAQFVLGGEMPPKICTQSKIRQHHHICTRNNLWKHYNFWIHKITTKSYTQHTNKTKKTYTFNIFIKIQSTKKTNFSQHHHKHSSPQIRKKKYYYRLLIYIYIQSFSPNWVERISFNLICKSDMCLLNMWDAHVFLII